MLLQRYSIHQAQIDSNSAFSVARSIRYSSNMLKRQIVNKDSIDNTPSRLPVLMYHDILIIDIKRNLWQLVRWINFPIKAIALFIHLQSAFLDLTSDFLDPLSIFLVKRVRFNSVTCRICSSRWRNKPYSCFRWDSGFKPLNTRGCVREFSQTRTNSRTGSHLGFVFVTSLPLAKKTVGGTRRGITLALDLFWMLKFGLHNQKTGPSCEFLRAVQPGCKF